MENVIHKKSAPLPYASIISKLICACAIHPLNNGERCRPQEIGMNTLCRLGYEKRRNAWVLKQGRVRPRPQNEDEEMEEPEEIPSWSPLAPTHDIPVVTHDPQPMYGPDSSRELLDVLHEMTTWMEGEFKDVRKQLQNFESRFDALKLTIGNMEVSWTQKPNIPSGNSGGNME